MEERMIDRGLATKERRMKVANRYLFVGGTGIGICSVIMMLLEPGMFAGDSKTLLFVEIALLLLFIGFGMWFSWFKYEHLLVGKRGQIWIMLLIFIVANLGCENTAVVVMAYGLAVVSMMYENSLTTNSCIFTMFFLMTAKITYLWYRNQPTVEELRNEYIAQLMIVVLLTFAINRISKLNISFNEAARAVIEDEKEAQKKILGDVLEIAGIVQKNSLDVGKTISKLKESAENVSLSIAEISHGNQNTCESVEHQNRMTQNITNSINLAAEKTNEMAESFSEVEKEVQRGMELMKLLDVQSEVIEKKSTLAVEAMEKLSHRTEDMESFTEEILNISGQTNLLALNASIEAARAGESGKGFAVVADEIRKLSDATRRTTEKIAILICELNQETKNVTEAVGMAKEAVVTQNQAIADTERAFSNVGGSVKNLTVMVTDIKESASQLIVSNNEIVDSISQLSAVTEEVTASSEAVNRIADENERSAVEANDRLKEIIDISQKLNEYTSM